MYDVVNRSQNINLPVVAINATDIQRTPDRVYNKHDSFYYNNSQFLTPGSITRHRTPVPVRISLDLSILAGYQLDLEQIASNFIAYFNPYIILSTKVPSELGPSYDLEVRTKAQWGGSLTISTPIELTYAEKFRRVGDASFTLDSWIYPEAIDDAKPIYFIDANFYVLSGKVLDTSSYYYLSSETFTLSTYPEGVQDKETVSLSGTPTITNIFFSTSGKNIELDSTLSFPASSGCTLLLYGYQFDFLDYVLLSSNNVSMFSSLTSLPSTYYGTVSGQILNLSSYEVLNNNMLQVFVPAVNVAGNFDIITYNQAGWSSTYEVNEFNLERT